MVELRWLRKEIETHHERGERVYRSTKLVLQMRQQVDKNIYAGTHVDKQSTVLVWSEWKDVPEVSE